MLHFGVEEMSLFQSLARQILKLKLSVTVTCLSDSIQEEPFTFAGIQTNELETRKSGSDRV